MLVSKNAVNLSQMESTYAIFNILMALSNQNQKSLWNKSLSISVQMTVLHLGQLSEQNQKQEVFSAYLLDIVRLARGEPVKWMS